MLTTISWSRHLSSHTIDGKVARLKARVGTRKIRLSLPAAAVAVDEEPDEVEDVAVVVVDAVSVVVGAGASQENNRADGRDQGGAEKRSCYHCHD
ncbi:hypothetical protein PR003_g20799 [Phytophthora rubi]|uniref:Uncharacterized protein n=1 Tax=Phytophthora rubi TaxID=129364 RepID=A0A6A4DGX2_9STRA|nr:hypothetical protein PR003_g20799 [Phytophthora rubi]